MVTYDIVIIGAGIAGASLAAELAPRAKVLLLEMEHQPGYHATGRSAAYFAPSYGNEVIRALTALSASAYQNGAENFGVEVLKPRPALFVGTSKQQESIDNMFSEQPELRLLGGDAIRQIVPLINDNISYGLLDDTGGDLDVDAILQGYLKRFRSFKDKGCTLKTKAQVFELTYSSHWTVKTPEETFAAPIVVNAAGAWADQVAALANIGPLNIVPKRRTAVLVDPPPEQEISLWPLVVDVDETFYFKPDAGKLLLSPADETPTAAADVHPDELDVAIAIDRVSQVTHLNVKAVNHQWAGLRSFAEDKSPVIGFDPRATGLFWLAGQGGYGVQTAPGVAALAAQLCLAESVAKAFAEIVPQVAPNRLL